MKQLLGILLLICCSPVTYTDDASCKPCNGPVEEMVKDLNTIIEKESNPIVKKDITYCHTLTVVGAYTLARDGDICSTKLNDPADCFQQLFDFRFEWINFTCVLNMEVVKREIMEKQGSGIAKSGEGLGVQATKGKRGLFDGKAGVPKPPQEANLVGNWVKLGILGKTKICKVDKDKTEVDPFVLKDKMNFKNLECSCDGDRTVKQMCQAPESMGELKQAIGAAVQTIAADIVRQMILTCKHQMATKLNCGWDD